MTIKAVIKKLIGWDKTQMPFQPFEKISYSQSGEDLIIEYIFRLRGIATPAYLDLGCNHPFSLNNTFLFYKKGARGVNVDANPDLIKLFEQHREHDTNINLGVGSESGQLDFYILSESGLSTFSHEEALMQESLGIKLISKIQVQVKTVNNIIEQYFGGHYPDLVSIDVEGLDYEIFTSMNLSHSKPKVICLETVEYTTDGTGKKRTTLIQTVIEKGYTVYADTNINTIFVENNFWFGYKNNT